MATVYYTATTLDGFIATPEHSLDWLLTRDIDSTGPMGWEGFRAGIGAAAFGANTYQWVLDHAPDEVDDQLPTWVFTHRRFPARDGITFTSVDVGNTYAEMAAAAAGKDVWVVGGGDLAGQFADAGLLDEVVVNIAPVTLGSGRPLLPRHVELRLTDVARNRDFVGARYAVVTPAPA